MNERRNQTRTPLYVLRAYLIFIAINFVLSCGATQLLIWMIGKGGIEWTGVGRGLIILAGILSPLNTLLLYILYVTNVSKTLLKSSRAVALESLSYLIIAFVMYCTNIGGELGPILLPYVIIGVAVWVYVGVSRL